MNVKKFMSVLKLCNADGWFEEGWFKFAKDYTEIISVDPSHISGVVVRTEPIGIEDELFWDFASLQKALKVAEVLGVEEVKLNHVAEKEEYVELVSANNEYCARIDCISTDATKPTMFGMQGDAPTISGKPLKKFATMTPEQFAVLQSYLKTVGASDQRVVFKIVNGALNTSMVDEKIRRMHCSANIKCDVENETEGNFVVRGDMLIKILDAMSALKQPVVFYYIQSVEGSKLLCLTSDDRTCRYYIATCVE